MEFQELFVRLTVTATLLGDAVLIAFALLFVVRRNASRAVMRFLGNNALLVGTLVSGASVSGSLVFSEVIGFEACILCWTQRFLMYPIPALLLAAMARRSLPAASASILLAVLGVLISAYHWAKDMLLLYGASANLGCPEVIGLPSCDKILVNEFGYITIPMMSLTAFAWILLVLLVERKTR